MITSSNIGNSTLSNVLIAKLRDYAILTKYRLNLTVVFSSVIGYLYAYGSNFQLVNIWWLSLAGFLVTGSANGINQVLEKDYDKLMKRTADRPGNRAHGRSRSSLDIGLNGGIGYFDIVLCFQRLGSINGGNIFTILCFYIHPVKTH